MSKFKRTASFVALFACLSYNALLPAQAAQMGFQESLEDESAASPLPETALGAEFCEEPTLPRQDLNSEDDPEQTLSLGPNLIASAGASDVPLGLEGRQDLIAQVPICDLGGVAPATGGVGGGFNPLPLILGAAGAGGTIAAIVGGGDDDDPAVPEPSDFATAGLFASIGIAGILYRRKLKKSDS